MIKFFLYLLLTVTQQHLKHPNNITMSRNTTKIYISYKTQCQLKTNFDIIVVNNKLILFKKRKKSTTKTYLSLVTQLKTTTVLEIKN